MSRPKPAKPEELIQKLEGKFDKFQVIVCSFKSGHCDFTCTRRKSQRSGSSRQPPWKLCRKQLIFFCGEVFEVICSPGQPGRM